MALISTVRLTAAGAGTGPAGQDTSFWSLSLPEIQSYKAYFQQELESYQEEKNILIMRGIRDGEHLLENYPNAKMIDQIIIRLADLYFYMEKDEYLQKMEEYDDLLIMYESGQMDSLPGEPVISFRKSMYMYQRIIDEFPKSDLLDDAIYSKGYLYEEMGDHTHANQIYLHLISEYPDSKYIPEACMRLAEYYFNPPVNNLDRAIDFYLRVTEHKTSPRYDEALYKLGWSYYRMDKYPEAISYFTMLADREPSEGTYARIGMTPRADLREESLDYIAISFIDFGGPAKALEYLHRIGNPVWGKWVMEKLGDVYKDQKEEFEHAVSAYQALLEYAPDSPEAPVFQKKIVDSYLAQNREGDAFAARQKLFLLYHPDSDWWQNTGDEKARLTAYGLSEEALRENIFRLIQQAESLSSTALFREAVQMADTYLVHYPEDLYALMIRWNMALILDTKLNQYERALKEYLTISLVYSEDKYVNFARAKGLGTIRDAAENAIVVADSLVLQEQRANPSVQQRVAIAADLSGLQNVSNTAVPLSTAETWLAAAYDNYIKLFPFDEKTAAILVNAGVLYFNHNQYDEALKYFKTLTEYFPRSEQVQQVMLSMMESYFGKNDYDSAELIARRIVRMDTTGSVYKKKAENRLGESIFLKAQMMAEQGKSRAAADEYYRLAMEAPTLEFTDRALFNAGNEYDQIGDYAKAIRVYEQLYASHSGSPLVYDALNNLAYDYGEVNNFQKGGERYEALAGLSRGTERSRNALYNAWIFYGKAENWPKGVDIGKQYIQTYPMDSVSAFIYYQVGEYHEVLDQPEEAMAVFSDYPVRFPQSPLGVKALFRVGKYLKEQNRDDQAEQMWHKTFIHHQALVSRGVEGDEFHAAEALFLSNAILMDRFSRIRFRLPQTEMDLAIERKQKLLGQLVNQYAQVAALGTIRLPESVYQIGHVYEQFAETWAAQEISAPDATTRAVLEKRICDRATEIYGQALTAYRKAIRILEKMEHENAAVLAKTSVTDTTQQDGMDTQFLLTGEWLAKARTKVSENLYRMADISGRSIDPLLDAPVPAELQDIARLEYKSQLLLKAIKPLVDRTVQAHFRNLEVADSLNLKNAWVDSSKHGILNLLTVMGDRYGDLAMDALSGYRQMSQTLSKQILVRKQPVTEEQIDAMMHYIEIGKTYNLAALALYKEGGLATETSKFYADTTSPCQDRIIAFSIDMADSLERAVIAASVDMADAEKKFNESGDLMYEEGLATFEDNVYFLKDNLKSLLETAYTVSLAFARPVSRSAWLPIRLVKLDPQTYRNRFGISVETAHIATDTTWRYTWIYNPGWDRYDYKPHQWQYLKWGNRDVAADTLGSLSHQVYGTAAISQQHTFYVRKQLDLPGYPIAANMQFFSSNPCRIYLNGSEVLTADPGQEVDVTGYLKQSGNVLAMDLLAQQTFTINGTIQIQYIPLSELPQTGGYQ